MASYYKSSSSIFDLGELKTPEGITYKKRFEIENQAEQVLNEKVASGEIDEPDNCGPYWDLVYEMIEQYKKNKDG